MKKIFVFIVLIVLASAGFAQTSFLKDAAAKLDKALIQKDSVTLKQLLHKNVT